MLDGLFSLLSDWLGSALVDMMVKVAIEDHVIRKFTFAIYLVEVLIVLALAVFLPEKKIVLIELITELLFLGVCLFIFYSFSKLNIILVEIGWSLFCLGLGLDVIDEFANTEGVLHKNAEDIIGMFGIILVAIGFHKASDELQRLLRAAHRTSKKYENLAHTDKLTGLANRTKFVYEMETAISAAEKLESKVAILFIDLNKFKPANDTYGHEVGDLLLQAVSERLKRLTREYDLLCRWGGDEFLILQTGFDEDSAPEDLSNRVIESFQFDFHIHNFNIQLGASIGYAIYPVDATSPDELIRKADIAMYEAKKGKRNPYRFDSSLNDSMGDLSVNQ